MSDDISRPMVDAHTRGGQGRNRGVRTRGGGVRTRGGGVRTRGGGVRTRGGGVRTRGGGVRTRGGRGATSRPQIMEDINMGFVEELHEAAPLEVPLHPPKRRRFVPSSNSEFVEPFVEVASTSSFVEPFVEVETDDVVEIEVPTPSSFVETVFTEEVPSPSSFLECTGTTTPRARAVARRRSTALTLSQIGDVLNNYGSEDEEELEDDEVEPPMVPRSLRMFLFDAEDTPEEMEAAGTVAVTSEPLVIAEPHEIVDGVQHEPTTIYDFNFRPIIGNQQVPASQRRQEFTSHTGPLIEPTSNPYEIFIRIWDRSVMEHIVMQTNLYAQQYAEQLISSGQMGPNSRISKWCDTNVNEMYIYFAIVLGMGLVVKSRVEEYWSQDDDLTVTPNFGKYMKLSRFYILSKCLHFNNNHNLNSTVSPREAKIYKIAPIVDHLNSKFQTMYSLSQNVALDESLTQWKGWLNIKQYIPNKKSAVGIKTYEVCDSRTGYLWRFEVHTGAELPNDESVISGGIPNLVLRLLRGLENSGRTIWMDNYYNSPALARVLKMLGLDCVGTLRTNRQFVPEQIALLKKGDMQVGQVVGCTSGDVDLMVWRDQNRVAMISTYHGVTSSGSKPNIVRDYNVCMGGVDRKDQMLSTYPIERKRTRVWYKKFFKRLLNVSVLNAYIICKHFDAKMEHRDFRKNLVAALLSNHYNLNSQQSDDRLPTTLWRSDVGHCPNTVPADVIQHLPTELPQLPCGKTRQTRMCACCKKRRTSYFCEKCNVALCFGRQADCYRQYHL